jgi:6-phosphogluconate dehydrogenase
MQVGIIGLGRMGFNMGLRLLGAGIEVAACNRSPGKTAELAARGASAAASPAELVGLLAPPRTVWIMLPAELVEERIAELAGLLTPGDLIVDGGNSHYRDDPPRFEHLSELGLRYLDVGVSGGVWGLEKGYCLMAGGARADYERLAPVWKALCAPGGHLYCGPAGAGHYVKMIHNAIEYGLMQAYGEGFELLTNGPYGEQMDLAAVAKLWGAGSVVRSWLLELLAQALAGDGRLEGLRGWVEDSGEGRWSVEEALRSATAAPVTTLALMERFRSRRADTFADKVVAALRREFGGHPTKSA